MAAEALGPELHPFPSHSRGLAQPDIPTVDPELTANLQQAPAPLPEAALPHSEEASRLVLTVRDPEWLFAYWTVVQTDREQNRIGQPHGAPPLLLRIYELGLPDLAPSEAYFDITVIDDARGWYVHLPHSGGQWRATLGFLDNRGELYALCESNTVNVPGLGATAAWPEEEAWGPTIETNGHAESTPGAQACAAGAERCACTPSGGEWATQGERWLSTAVGASEAFQRQLRPGGASEQLPAPGALGGASEQLVALVGAPPPGAAASQPPLKPAGAEEEQEQGFWLRVHTELIVYGATLPDAQVTVQGQPIRLRPDGTFTLRFALPDGEQIIPVRAVSADESDERQITPVVIRLTH
jgi:hypothetical protein